MIHQDLPKAFWEGNTTLVVGIGQQGATGGCLSQGATGGCLSQKAFFTRMTFFESKIKGQKKKKKRRRKKLYGSF